MQILIVDDDRGSLLTYKFWLEGYGFNVSTAQDGKTGMELLGRTDANTVLLDLYMPDMDGFEVLKAIKARRPDTRVIIMSGAHDAGNCDFLKAALALGADSTLAKPFRPEDLMHILGAEWTMSQ